MRHVKKLTINKNPYFLSYYILMKLCENNHEIIILQTFISVGQKMSIFHEWPIIECVCVFSSDFTYQPY